LKDIYKYSGESYNIYGPTSGSNFDECRDTVVKVLRLNEPCAHQNCTFGGIWDGGKGSGQKNLVVTSSFYYRSSEVYPFSFLHTLFNVFYLYLFISTKINS